jgi:hypothetical protein
MGWIPYTGHGLLLSTGAGTSANGTKSLPFRHGYFRLCNAQMVLPSVVVVLDLPFTQRALGPRMAGGWWTDPGRWLL